MNTTYKVSPRWPGYSVTWDGAEIRNTQNRVIKQHDNNGYRYFCFYQDGVKSKMGVHRLVADAWIGRCPDGKEIDHIDGNRGNNNYENLRYVTHIENMVNSPARPYPSWLVGMEFTQERRLKMSLAKLGAKHIRALKVDPERVKGMKAAGMTQLEIARELGCGRTAIGDILRGSHWSQR